MDTLTALHAQKIKRISEQVRNLDVHTSHVHIAKGGVNHVVPIPGDTRFRGKAINVKELDEILLIDPRKKICVAEPGVRFSTLIKETVKVGFIPTVVPELEGITIGGAVAGCSVESMSYKYGGFHDSCLAYEVIQTDGTVITCSPKKDRLLFEMVHGSYGTLGILTKLTFRLIPAKQFVKMTYRHYDTIADFKRDTLIHCRTHDHDFIDAIFHTKDKLVLCLGDFVDKAPYVSNYRGTQIFYKSTLAKNEDYLSTFDYCFRYDTECHWLSKTYPVLETPIVRYLFGKYFLGSTNMLTWAKRLEQILKLKKRPDVVCDVFIPSKRLEDFYHWYTTTFDFFPLWVVPYRFPTVYPWLDTAYAKKMIKSSEDNIVFDCAIYGKPNSEPDVDYSVLLEEATVRMKGIKTLISRNHFAREVFWRIYNRKNYLFSKKRLDPRGLFPSLYEKFHTILHT
jgi:FAD/FMN-containing dehydrogenase